MPAASRYGPDFTLAVSATQELFRYRLRPCTHRGEQKKALHRSGELKLLKRMRPQKGPQNQRSELELGLDQTAEGIHAVGALLREGLAQVVDGRGDRDVVGDLELVEEFPACVLVSRIYRMWELTNGSTEGVAFDEDVDPLEADIPARVASS
jgi:hypothetical protein